MKVRERRYKAVWVNEHLILETYLNWKRPGGYVSLPSFS